MNLDRIDMRGSRPDRRELGHVVAQIPTAHAGSADEKILINAYLQAESYRQMHQMDGGLTQRDLLSTLNGDGSRNISAAHHMYPHLSLAHAQHCQIPIQMSMPIPDMIREAVHLQQHHDSVIDTAIVDGVIRALEGDSDMGSQPPKKKLKGPPPAAVHREWTEWYNDLLEYGALFGHYNVPSNYETHDGKKLGWWLTNQRRSKKQNLLRTEKVELLQKLVDAGTMRWTTEKPVSETGASGWESWFQDLLKYDEENGHANVPVAYQTTNGRKLGQWMNNQKRAHRLGKLAPERDAALQKLVNAGRLVW